mmetsp:Transcript_123748/g.396003  ORF Transcript_123748/g.396003 Transcript_123748/m.396003 type:complete len:314 (-) Transcript_123748:1958-2899(-)
MHLRRLLRQHDQLRHPAVLRLRIRDHLAVGHFEGLDFLGVPVERIAHHALQVVHALPHGYMVCVGLDLVLVMFLLQIRNGDRLLLGCVQAAGHQLDFRLRLLNASRVLVRVLGQRGLQAVHTFAKGAVRLLQRGLLRRQTGVRPLQVAQHPAVALAGREPAVHGVDLGVRCRDLLNVGIGGIAQEFLDVGEAILNGGVSCMQGLHALHLVHMLGVRCAEGLDLPGMLVGGVPQELLEVIHALLQRRVMGIQRRFVVRQCGVVLLQVTDRVAETLAHHHTSLHLLKLDMCSLQSLGVPIGRVPEHLLDVVHAVL